MSFAFVQISASATSVSLVCRETSLFKHTSYKQHVGSEPQQTKLLASETQRTNDLDSDPVDLLTRSVAAGRHGSCP